MVKMLFIDIHYSEQMQQKDIDIVLSMTFW